MVVLKGKKTIRIYVKLLFCCLTIIGTDGWSPFRRCRLASTLPVATSIVESQVSTSQKHNNSNTVEQQHAKFMALALQQAEKAKGKGEVPIGAVVVERLPDGKTRILSKAHNMVETNHDASAHAELLALRKAGRKVKNWRLPNATLYATLEPCPMCLTAAQGFRVSSVVYGAPDLRLGAIETHIKLLDVVHPFHTIEEVVPGVASDESSALLKDFFRKRRKENKSKTQPRHSNIWRRLRNVFSRRST